MLLRIVGGRGALARRIVLLSVAPVWTLTSAGLARAQNPSAVLTLRGFVYDSLHGIPLSGAFVSIEGTTLAAISDRQGHFTFERIRPGRYTFLLHHDLLDSIGFSGRRIVVTVGAGNETVRLALPSLPTLWKAACSNRPVPADSGFVYGMIRWASGRETVAGAIVKANWIEPAYSLPSGFEQKHWGIEVAVDSSGYYTICGVPRNVGLQLTALKGGSASSAAVVEPLALGIARHDFYLPVPGGKGGALDVGTIAGSVRDDNGIAIAGALISLDSLRQIRTVGDGTFILNEVLAGTRQLVVRSIGTEPVVMIVHVLPRDTANVAVRLRKVMTLPEVTVTAPTWRQALLRDLEERRRLGLGHFRDSTAVGRLPSMPAVFDGISGVLVRRGVGHQFNVLTTGGCELAVWINRARSEPIDLYLVNPREVALVEVYPRDLMTPEQYRVRRYCGAIVVWTKDFFW